MSIEILNVVVPEMLNQTPIKRGRGRPKKYATDEERKAHVKNYMRAYNKAKYERIKNDLKKLKQITFVVAK
jgi:hypothetical protein